MKVKQKAAPAEQKQTAVRTVDAGNLPALPGEWEAELANSAKEVVALEAPATQAFSTQSGILSYNGQAMPNNEMRVVIVGAAFLNSFYINKFDPNNIISPLCFAVSETGEEMAPHENSFKPQGGGEGVDPPGQCFGCPHSEWGSDPNSPSGRGKACKETRRLSLIPESALEDGIGKATIATLNIPVMSVRNWSAYIHTLAAAAKRPYWAVVTRVFIVADAKSQFKIDFEVVDAINDGELLQQIKEKRVEGLRSALLPFGMMSQEQFDAITAENAKPKKARKF